MPNITLLDDDRNFLQILSFAFEGFRLNTFSNPLEALSSIKFSPPDAVILDLHMGDTDGFEVCKEIRKFDLKLPVFFLTSDSTLESINEGMDLGCVDYLSKSTPIQELKLRISHRVKAYKKGKPYQTILEFGVLRMNVDSHSVTMNGSPIAFSPKEFEILKVFLEKPNKLLSKDELHKTLWRGVHVDSNNIDTHLFHMRKKIHGGPTQIQTLKGLGYILRSGF